MTPSYPHLRAQAEGRKARRAEKRLELAQGPIVQHGPAASQDAILGLQPPKRASWPVRTPVRRKAGKPKKAKRTPSRKKLTDACKKRILGVGGKWSQAVRARDGRCLMCGKTDTLQAHHWLFRRSHSMALAVDIANGITLCYGCHIGRVHHDGDGFFLMELAAVMTAMVGKPKVDEMIETSKHTQPLSLEWWQNVEAGLKAALRATSRGAA